MKIIMNKPLNKIEKLIAELCPEGVEYSELKKVTLRTNNIKWADVDGEKFRYIDLTSVDRVTHAIAETQTITSENAPSRAQQRVREGDVIFGTTRPMLKRYTLIPAEYDGNICSTGYCVLRPNTDRVLPNFFFHLLGTESFYAHVEANERGASYPAITDSAVKAFRIPIPLLAIQQEIVKILDTFTTLEAELGAELEARKKQYEYYRKDLMLSNNDGDWKTLGDIYEFQYGEGNTIPNTGGKYPVYGGNRLAGQHNKYNSEDAPVIGHIGAYAGIVNWVNGKHFVTYNGVICKIKANINPRYGYYLLLLQDFRSQAHSGSQPFISYDILKKATVQIPDLSHQDNIVAILDKFDALVNDISVGLPAELNARRKQYEYYRGKLLTFKPLEKDHANQ